MGDIDCAYCFDDLKDNEDVIFLSYDQDIENVKPIKPEDIKPGVLFYMYNTNKGDEAHVCVLMPMQGLVIDLTFMHLEIMACPLWNPLPMTNIYKIDSVTKENPVWECIGVCKSLEDLLWPDNEKRKLKAGDFIQVRRATMFFRDEPEDKVFKYCDSVYDPLGIFMLVEDTDMKIDKIMKQAAEDDDYEWKDGDVYPELRVASAGAAFAIFNKYKDDMIKMKNLAKHYGLEEGDEMVYPSPKPGEVKLKQVPHDETLVAKYGINHL